MGKKSSTKASTATAMEVDEAPPSHSHGASKSIAKAHRSGKSATKSIAKAAAAAAAMEVEQQSRGAGQAVAKAHGPGKSPHNHAKGKFSTLHLKTRRSTRPVPPKENKSARVLAENAAAAATKGAVADAALGERRRLLLKLLARQKSAGKLEAAAQTQQQIDSLVPDQSLNEVRVQVR